MQKALGVIETYGLLAAVTVADTMVKAANVSLIGYELARGSGMASVKIEGDVGAVKAALASGQAQAEELGLYRGKNLIPRPAENLDVMVFNQSTIGYADEEVVKAAKKEAKPAAKKETKPAAKKAKPEAKKAAPAKKEAAGGKRRAKRRTSCDLCKDPRCTRKFGQPHKLCIHFGENKE